jgi:ketosteroid isomerase-like protein
MKQLLLSLLPLLALALAPLRAADDPQLAKVQAADDERVAAMIAGDHARMSAVFSDDLHYAHSTGAVDAKAKYIEKVSSGYSKYNTWKYEERKFTFPAPGIALMSGRAHLNSTGPKGTAEMTLSFLAVWRLEKGQWRFLAWQSCKIPPPEPAAAAVEPKR